jgi:starch synthase
VDPATDTMIAANYSLKAFKKGKLEIKRRCANGLTWMRTKPLISFIGRLVDDKGADLLAEACNRSIKEHPDG